MKFSHGWMADTQPEALRVYLDLNHARSPQQKLDAVCEMWETMRATLAAQEREAHPSATDREIFLRVAARMIGPELVRKAYGWAPE
jgi:hypothetical protein